MKVYAKFRIDIDKEDESIYTQKAVNLMQKLGCKAEKLYSSMERYTFTVDIKEAVYRELVELKKEIDQVFQYDEDTEEDDDELLDIIEPDIWCSYIPKYTQEEEKNAIGYYIDLAGYEFEENEKKVYESLCPECETFFQNKEYTFKKKKLSLDRATEIRSLLLNKGYKNFSIKVINITDNPEKRNLVEIEEIK